MDTGANIEEKKFLHDSYLEWCAGEGIPIAEDFGIHMPDVEVKHWPRYDANGAFVHLKGRGDWLSVILVEVPPGSKTSPQQHLFEEVVYVLSGHGSTTIETSDGKKRSFEWGKGSLFALPLNGKYQHFNGSGREAARLASTNNLPMVMNVFHSDKFVFDNPFHFPEREGGEDYFSGEGLFIPKRPGRHMWETNFVPDLAKFELQKWDARGAGGSNIMFVLADGTMHGHMSEMPVGTYKKAHRHGPGAHLYITEGEGYVLTQRGNEARIRCDWQEGSLYLSGAGEGQWLHQHFNVGATPATYLVLNQGLSRKYAVNRWQASQSTVLRTGEVSGKKGGYQTEYEDEDPEIHRIFEDELRKRGITCKMKNMVPW